MYEEVLLTVLWVKGARHNARDKDRARDRSY